MSEDLVTEEQIVTEAPVKPIIHGIMAEFDTGSELRTAAEKSDEAGYTCFEGYSPFPVEGITEALHFHTRLPLWILLAGIFGGAGGFFMQYYAAVIDYPNNVGGRPLDSWPSFIPITFELTILFAGLMAVILMLAANDLPKPYHPVFNVPAFEHASSDKFFLVIEAVDPKFDQINVQRFLETLHPRATYVVDC